VGKPALKNSWAFTVGVRQRDCIIVEGISAAPAGLTNAASNVGGLPAVQECEECFMHVHQNQVNPNAQLDAMYAAQKAAAKREAERTRKKLVEFASELAGEADSEACVVKLGAREESQAETKQQNPQPQRKQKKNYEQDQDDAERSISDWA
jgi:hypothetical protein